MITCFCCNLQNYYIKLNNSLVVKHRRAFYIELGVKIVEALIENNTQHGLGLYQVKIFEFIKNHIEFYLQ